MARLPQRIAYQAPVYRRMRVLIAAGLKGPCVDCGTFLELTVDHQVPLAQGGTNDESNLIPRCRTCNYAKGGRVEKRG